ncbi:MAG: histidine kinase [Acidobacteriota bacterium]|nr:histidine kinase [Acidobacteriota bacterium]MDQ3420343.1 histidine kinase [Acidobacteriota bacterium]
MHPLLARGERLALYLALWIIVGALLAALLSGEGELSTSAAAAIAFPLSLAYAFVCLSAWYVARSTPIATSGLPRLLATACGAAALSSGAWVLLSRAWNSVLSRWWDVRAPFGEVAPIIFGFGVLLYLLSIAVGYIASAFEHARAAERRELQAQVLSKEAELRSLRAQIDPHFLFNSLHSISALTAADPPGARRMTVLLGDFLRESLSLGAAERIPLSRELALLHKYLEIERVRLGERLQVAIDGGDAGACLVPPLLLQPVVENAVTHGVAHVLEGGRITVTATCSPVQLTIVIQNPTDADRPRKTGTGLGLANVRSRLAALYGRSASVNWAEQDRVWRVEIVLPATRDVPNGDKTNG